MLKSLCKSAPKERQGNGGRIAYRFNTRQHAELTNLFKLFYQNGRKVIPTALELDPIMLAVWYMDDGSKCRESDVYLNTQQFNVQDQLICVKALLDLGIESSLNRDKQYWRIRIKKSSLPKFFSYIFPHIISCMRYKLSYNPVETCSFREQSRLVLTQTAKTPPPHDREDDDIVHTTSNSGQIYDVGSTYPGGGEAPKGLAVRQLKSYVSWVQTVVRQVGLLSAAGVET